MSQIKQLIDPITGSPINPLVSSVTVSNRLASTKDASADSPLGRVRTEHSELSTRIDKLKVFVDSDAFNSLPEIQQQLLRRQFSVMTEYEDILQQRIRAWV